MSATPSTVKMDYPEEGQTALLTSLFSRAKLRFVLRAEGSLLGLAKRGDYLIFLCHFRLYSSSTMGYKPLANLAVGFLSLQMLPGTCTTACL